MNLSAAEDVQIWVYYPPSAGPGQTHLNSDAKIADEGHPQGGEGTHKGCPYFFFRPRNRLPVAKYLWNLR